MTELLGIAPVIRLAKLIWYRRARVELQRKEPTRPDLPYILLRIAALERDGK